MNMSNSVSPLRINESSYAATADDRHAVSWGAVIAGATGAAALSLILLILGVGLGLSSVSPWTSAGVAASTFGFSTIAWLTFVQVAASGMGGYLAGRLRAKWTNVHPDETYFRDTAHGFLAWCVATLVTATVLASAVGNIVGSVAQTGATITSFGAASVAAGAAAAATGKKGATSAASESVQTIGSSAGLDYWVDSLFRRTVANDGTATSANATAAASQTPNPNGSSAEVASMFAAGLTNGKLSAEDGSYLAQLVAQRTGLPPAEAQARVTQTFANVQGKLQAAKESTQKAADTARKASAYMSLWLFVSLLIGAFVASFAATYGGRQRQL